MSQPFKIIEYYDQDGNTCDAKGAVQADVAQYNQAGEIVNTARVGLPKTELRLGESFGEIYEYDKAGKMIGSVIFDVEEQPET